MFYQVKENGQFVSKIIECGLKSFKGILDGYLSGINADRHLDKLTDDFIKAQEGQNNNSGNNNNNNGNYNNYRKNYNGYKKPYNNNRNYNNNGGNNNGNNWNPPKQQDLSSYQIN